MAAAARGETSHEWGAAAGFGDADKGAVAALLNHTSRGGGASRRSAMFSGLVHTGEFVENPALNCRAGVARHPNRPKEIPIP